MEDGLLVSTPDLRPSLLSIVAGLQEEGYLKRVVTTLAVSQAQRERWSRWPVVGTRLERLLWQRRLPDFLEGKTDCVGARELLRALVARTGRKRLTHVVWKWAEAGFDTTVAQRYAGRYRYLYGMEHASAATFAAQRRLGGRCFLRQVAAHGRTINTVLQGEAERFPQYVTPYLRLLLAEGAATAQRKEREYALADLIVANSTYVSRTFVAHGIAAQKIIAIPTGCPPLDSVGGRAGKGTGPLRFLYVGTLSLRKGVPYLLEAWRQWKPGVNAELWLAGSREIPLTDASLSEPGVRYLGQLSQDALAQVYREADVLVLPTVCEGMAHAVLEALSYGLPVITTPESGCADFITQGENGWLIPARNSEALVSALDEALTSRGQLAALGQVSRRKAAAWTIEQSNEAHVACLRQFITTGAVTDVPR
jgi:glycosyltransferase involved in cell wall biosynthesis